MSFSALGNQTEFEYDFYGRLIGLGDGEDDVEWQYQYDALGRLVVEQKDADEDGLFECRVEYSYDADSNRTEERIYTTAGVLSFTPECGKKIGHHQVLGRENGAVPFCKESDVMIGFKI